MNHRLFLLHGDSKYYDVLERTLYNGLISGVSLDGGAFFYPNPLASNGGYSRKPWFGCACCPSNISRFIPSLPGYVYAVRDNDVYVNLFMGNDARLSVNGKCVDLSQSGNYVWDGKTRIEVRDNRAGEFALKIRIPGWVRNRPVPGCLYTYTDSVPDGFSVCLNGELVDADVQPDGYVSIKRKWKKGDNVDIAFEMRPRFVESHKRVAANRGRVAVERGPVVYCAEWPDNDFDIHSVLLNTKRELKPEKSDKLCGIMQLKTQAQSFGRDADGDITVSDVDLTLIPYYAWAHRGEGNMSVWLPVRPFALPE